MYKDISTLLLNPVLVEKAVDVMANGCVDHSPTAIAGVESRGFLFGLPVAQALGLPFVMIRKAGKLPASVYSESYTLEYGEATLEMHRDALPSNARVIVVDDILATGGTAAATASLISQSGANCVGYSFLLELTFLNGRNKLNRAAFAVARVDQ